MRLNTRLKVLKKSHFLYNYLLGKKEGDEYVFYPTGVYKKKFLVDGKNEFL